MVFDSVKKRGVKRKSIPSPEEVEMPLAASYKDVLEKGRQLFFDGDVSRNALVLADSNGSVIDPGEEEEWKIGEFYSENGYKPSRFKLYVLYYPSKVIT